MIQIDYTGHPRKAFKQIIHDYTTTSLVLDDVLSSEETYSYVYQDLLDLLKYGIEHKCVREMPIRFRIHEDECGADEIDKMHVLEVRHFFSNMVLWYAFMKMENPDIMDDSFIMDWHNKNVNDIRKYMDEKIVKNFPYGDDYHSLNKIIDEIVYHMKAVSDAFGILFGYSASIYDIMRAEKLNPRIHDIIYAPLDTTLQPKELEDILNARNTELMHCFTTVDSDLRPLLLSGKNISANQFKEIFLRIGFKADLSNRTIPWFINSNVLITGIDTPAAFYIDAGSGHVALINGKLSMAKPGALSKKMNNNSTTVQLRHDSECCDSTRPIHYFVKDAKFLSLLDGRNYYDKNGELKILDGFKDTDLIGTTVAVRSPCTCAYQDGICRACYGNKLFDLNQDLFSQGSLAATKASEPLGQAILSTKHSQQTDSAEISFPEEFHKSFDIVSSEVSMADDIDSDLLIKLGEVNVEETDDGDAYYVNEFFMLDYNGEVKSHIKEEHDFPLYLAPPMVTAWKQFGEKPIPLDRFDDEDDGIVLFNIEVKSNNKTQGYQQVMSILDSKDHMGCANDLDAMCQKFAEVMIETGIEQNLVHFEMIVRGMLRKKSNDLEYPDFGPNGDHSDYTILRLTGSLSKNPSPMIRLSTGWLKKNLVSTSLYKAHNPSHLDPLFVPILADVIGDRPIRSYKAAMGTMNTPYEETDLSSAVEKLQAEAQARADAEALGDPIEEIKVDEATGEVIE